MNDMGNVNGIEARLARLEARHDIAALVTRYALACDAHDLDALAPLFSRDAEFYSPNGLMCASGHDAILAMFERVLALRGPGYHWTHDHLISFDRGSECAASGILLGHAETTPDGVQSIAAMRYDDEYRLEDGAWRFARREIRFLYYVPFADYGAALTRSDRVVAGGKRLKADFPENLATWQAFEARRGATQS